MHWKLVTDAAGEPITTAQAKTHLRVTHDDDDTYIGLIITLARQVAENLTDRAILTQTWELYLDDFPSSSSKPVYFPRSPLQSITSVAYIDTNGDLSTWGSDDYQSDINNEPGRLKPAYGETYPGTRSDYPTVKIIYKCGWTDDAGDAAFAKVPKELIHLVYLLLGHFYENREATAEITYAELPLTIKSLVDLVKVNWDF